jgi:hypothetical protein
MANNSSEAQFIVTADITALTPSETALVREAILRQARRESGKLGRTSRSLCRDRYNAQRSRARQAWALARKLNAV